MMRNLLVVVVVLVAFTAVARASTEDQKLVFVNPIGASHSVAAFGGSVAASGDWIAVADALGDYDDGTVSASEAGFVVLYERDTSGFVQRQVIGAPTPSSQNSNTVPDHQGHFRGFGWEIAMDGEIVVVGSPSEDYQSGSTITDAGAAYVYKRASGVWSIQATLHAATPVADGLFGSSVTVDGDRIAVAAIGEGDHGAIYFFEFSGSSWMLADTYDPASYLADGRVGDSNGIAMSGDILLAGAHQESVGTTAAAGCVLVVERDSSGNWLHSSRVDGPAADDDWFGFAVAIDGPVGGVGAYNWQPPSSSPTGGAWVLDGASSPWSVTQLSPPPSPDRFGHAADVYYGGVNAPRRAVVSDSNYNDQYTDQGAAHVYDYTVQNGWQLSDTLLASDASLAARLGYDVAIAPCYVVASTHAVGAAYVYEIFGCYQGPLEPCEPTEFEPCDGDLNGDNSTDAADLAIMLQSMGHESSRADLNRDGVVDASDLMQLMALIGVK